MFWSWEDMGGGATHVNFCSFWVWLGYLFWFLFALGFIYVLMVICGLHLEDYLTLLLLIFSLMDHFTFIWQTCFEKKVF